ncbi:MAG: SDR family NAD(P)-dependent oxidoreductase [Proteobacteria bacterium]|nr:SDR family NAD(P)-dependent oxidoreductase [Pseudomonadota bacterium]
MPAKSGGPSVWLVTGCSTGIGREIALAALSRGHRVAVTARDPARVEDIAARHPGRGLALRLDVTRSEQVESSVRETEAAFGRVDVLVNNAGYGYLAAVEEGEEAEVRELFETNYFGVVAMIKAVLPGMRRRGSGRIINISSMTGIVSNPGAVYYSSSKFALESLSEGLSKELEPFGIRVTSVKPGAFRTDWAGRSMKETRQPLAAYDDTVDARRAFIRSVDGTQAGDPRRAAEAVLMVSELEDPPLHLLLGRDVYEAYREKLDALQKSLEEWKAVSLDMDFRDE